MYYTFATFFERYRDSKTIWKKNLFLITGEDSAMKEEALRAIKSQLSGSFRTIVAESLSKRDDVSEDDLIEATTQINPMVGEQRIVLSAKTLLSLNRASKLLSLLPSAPQRVVFMEREESEAEGKFYELIKEIGVVITCNPIKDYDKRATSLMTQLLRDHVGTNLPPDSWIVKQILRRTGSNVIWMKNVALTLKLLKQPLTEEFINKYVDVVRSDEVFDIMFLIAVGNLEKCLTVYFSIAEKDDSALLILDQMAEYLLRVWAMQKIAPERRTPTYMSTNLKWSEFLVRRYSYMGKFYDQGRIQDSLNLINQGYKDVEVAGSKRLAVAHLLRRLCQNVGSLASQGSNSTYEQPA